MHTPTLADWTHAHAEADPNRRRVALALLHDRMVAARLPRGRAWLYLHRHVFFYAALWLLLGTFAALISAWAWPFAAVVAFLLVYPGERV